jgi:hypothetical protein
MSLKKEAKAGGAPTTITNTTTITTPAPTPPTTTIAPTPNATTAFASLATTSSTELKEEDRGKVHKENMDRLGSMSAEDVAEAQRELMASLPPEVVAMLRKRTATPDSSGGGSGGDDATLAIPAVVREAPVEARVEVVELIKEEAEYVLGDDDNSAQAETLTR